jgi:hypothetical protein
MENSDSFEAVAAAESLYLRALVKSGFRTVKNG